MEDFTVSLLILRKEMYINKECQIRKNYTQSQSDMVFNLIDSDNTISLFGYNSFFRFDISFF